jgi:hypothetical protein
VRLADLHQGDRVRFVRATNPNVANDDLFYEPAVPQGMTATVQKVQRDYALVRLDVARGCAVAAVHQHGQRARETQGLTRF